jgi:phosphohistidine swiveling domain-containing protein
MSANRRSFEYILPLDSSQATLETVGGKGASLAQLVAAGLPVPDGFHVTTDAYRRFVAENNLQPGILTALEGVDVSQPATLEAASRTIRNLFVEAQTPPDVAGAIALAYAELAGRDPAVAVRAQNGSPPRPAEPLAGRDDAVSPGQGAEPLAVRDETISPKPTVEPLAVRSSATAEDLPEASFAGQQDTFLNVDGYGEVLQAVKGCWASLWTARAIGYRARQGIGMEGLSLAVVVQLLVPAEAAGILFTANPVTGRRDQAMISAAWGLGEAVVGGLVTPDALLMDKSSGEVLDRQTADKQVMTVRANGGTEERPVPDELRRAPSLDDETAAELARLGVQIEELYGLPMDIEWALADGALAIVQARPITALPPEVLETEPELQPPTEWPLPKPKGQYMRGSIVDLMPDPLSPLFATLAIPAIARVGIKEVMRPLTRSEPALPEDYIVTINAYAYMGVAYTPREWWWIVTRMLLSFPRLLREGLPLWRDEIRPRYAETVARWQDRPVEAMPAAELWAGIQQVNDAAMLHLACLMVATTGASAGAEGLFTRVYEKVIERDGDPEAVTFLMGYDSTPIQAEKSLYDLAMWSQEQDDLAAYLLGTPTERLVAQLSADQAPVAAWQAFCERLRAYLQAYGHIIYDLDFAKPLPVDDPTPMLETVKMYLRDQGVNPHERQRAAEEKRMQAAEATLERLKGVRRWAFRKTLDMAQTMAQVRENALSDIGLGYPVLRHMLHELGRRLVQASLIAQGEDIFWLEADEVEDAVASLERGGQSASLAEKVAQRKATHEALKDVSPPPMLPPKKKLFGFNMESWLPAAEDSQAAGTLKGVAASAGCITGPACVLRGPEDFDNMSPGDVLVAGTTTPAWTPLFAMAAGIVTDIGGPLSHGSIVAREYGIPAVLGTGVATRRIHSGQVITVDGSAGTVSLL